MYFNHCLNILSDMMLHSAFQSKEFEKEEHVVVEENIKNEDDPENKLAEMSDALVYAGTPFANPVDTLAFHKGHFDHRAVIQFYKEYYHPKQMILSVVSNLPFETIVKSVKRTYFAKKHAGKEPCGLILSEPRLTSGIQYQLKQQSELKSTQITISFKTCNQYSKDKHILNFLKNVLSGALSSRLFTILREKNGLTYHSEINTDYCEVVGEFTIYAQLDSSKLLKNGNGAGVLPLIIQMINDLIRHGIRTDELEMFKHNIRGKMILSLENMDTQVEYNGTEYLLYNAPENIVPYSKIYETFYAPVSLEEIRRCIREYFHKDRMVVCVLGGHLPSLKSIQTVCETVVQ